MPMTDHCDVFASMSEQACNALFSNLSRQRPSLFNYGTDSFVANPALMCRRIVTANGLPSNQPLVARQSPIPVPGTAGAYAVEYCAQLTQLEVDLHPGNVIPLPQNLSPLSDQSFALHAQLCAGIACPDRDLLNKLGYQQATQYRPIDPAASLRGEDTRRAAPPRRDPVVLGPTSRIHCFFIDLFVTITLRRESGPLGPTIGVELRNLELVDIQPDGLEQGLECLLSATLSLGLLPRFKLAVKDIILSLGEYGLLSIGLTPVSASVPFNPSIQDDRLSVFVDVALT
jgi:hypothetical protein